MITELPQSISLHRSPDLPEVLHIHIPQRAPNNSYLLDVTQRIEETHIGINDTTSILEIILIVLLKPVFSLIYSIETYWQSPISIIKIPLEKSQICKFIIAEISPLGILLYMPITLTILILVSPTFKSPAIIRMMPQD